MKFFKIFLVFLVVFFSTHDVCAMNNLKRPRINTPVSEKELIVALENSHKKVFGYYPSKYRLFAAWAQTSLETGKGKLVYNRNIANIGAAKNQTYYVVSTHRYRHFLSIEESATVYWNILRKCSQALNSFDNGDMLKAAISLKRCRYFDADEKIYGRIMSSLFNEAYRKYGNL